MALSFDVICQELACRFPMFLYIIINSTLGMVVVMGLEPLWQGSDTRFPSHIVLHSKTECDRFLLTHASFKEYVLGMLQNKSSHMNYS